ncbi:MAG TPA: invasion associated locus B family protein, partial [Afifellaceae bacterium]|nr:invasion associated locus B family protein [Afifellaceae bacterium]
MRLIFLVLVWAGLSYAWPANAAAQTDTAPGTEAAPAAAPADAQPGAPAAESAAGSAEGDPA